MARPRANGGNNDGGQFFTPREVIRAMVGVIDPKIGETVHGPRGMTSTRTG